VLTAERLAVGEEQQGHGHHDSADHKKDANETDVGSS
jgi:hypothetical protein